MTQRTAAPARPARREPAGGPFRPSPHRPALPREIALIAACYGAYTWVRDAVPGERDIAVTRAAHLLGLEKDLHIDAEHGLNQLFAHMAWLGTVSDYYYATLHFIVTVGVLIWLYVAHPGEYRPLRRVLFATNLVALGGFWLFPLAPPRMLPGFVDTVLAYHTWGLYDSSPMAALSNQFAAMPSLHTGWSLWCAVAVTRLARRRWVKVTAMCYPPATVLVIIGTANHFVLDVVGGMVALICGFAVERAIAQIVRATRTASPAAT